MGKPIARAHVDTFTCPKHPPGIILIPALPSVTRKVDGFEVIRLGDFGICLAGPGQFDVVVEGSDTTLVCGLPIARKGDAMMHGGTITTGSPTEEDGGGTFSLPKNIKIGGDQIFKNKVVRDLFLLSTTPTGKKILAETAAHGQQVTIVSGQINRSYPDDSDSAGRGGKSGTTIDYNPDDHTTYVPGQGGKYEPCPAQLNLGHELVHSVRWGRGGATTSNSAEEPHVIGPPVWTKSPHDKVPPSPTENELRKDLRLGGPRATYSGWKKAPAHPAQDLRPGVCKP